jgi:hypothetical protein
MSHNSNSMDQYTHGSRLERLEADVGRLGDGLSALNRRVGHLEARETAELDRITRRYQNIDKWIQILAAAFVGMIWGLAISH